MKHLSILLPFSLTLMLLSACITEDLPDNTSPGNFETLWKILDQRYCFFNEKQAKYGLNWDSVYTKYRPQVKNNTNSSTLFDICAKMLAELRDGHVNLTAAHDIARYWKWFEDYPINRSDSLERIYLGKDYHITCGLKYRRLDNGISYIRCSSFENSIGVGNLNEILRDLSTSHALIIDIRGNGGGLVSSAERLAESFINEKTLVGYMSHKTGKGHNDFSKAEPIYLSPSKGVRWLKPVAILTNRECYSAANNFVMYMRSLPHVFVVGDRTGGGAGMPFSSELPNGWSVRFSACPMYDKDMVCTESGIDPDVKVDITSEDYSQGKDTIIETALTLLNAMTDKDQEKD